MDIQLPWTDGLKLTRQIHQHPLVEKSLTIAVTAFSSPEGRRRALDPRCDEFVPKPVRRDELYRVIDEQIEAIGAWTRGQHRVGVTCPSM